MRVQPFPPSRMRSSALSSEGCQNSSSGESSYRFLSPLMSICHQNCCPEQDSLSLQALGDKGHRHRHGLHIFWSLQCASVLANTRNVLHHALLHHDEEADQGKHSLDIRSSAAGLQQRLSRKIRSAEAFFLTKHEDILDIFEIMFPFFLLCFQHMIKYRYLPFTHGKRTYKGKDETGKTFAS